jgi:carboxyl-terminal processing protease
MDESTTSQPARRRVRRILIPAATALVLVGAAGAALLVDASPVAATTDTSSVAPCVAASEQPGPAPAATTIKTLQQAYECIFAHAYSGPVLDSREVLASAFKSLTEELQTKDLDRPEATLPKLTGNRGRDWAAFAKTYQNLLTTLPDDAKVRQAVAAATLKGMVASLNDNHSGWDNRQQPPNGGDPVGLGIFEAPSGRATPNVADAKPPLYIKSVVPGSPAAKAGLKPGDILVAVNDVPVSINGVVTVGTLEWLHSSSPQDTVRVKVQRPATDKTWTVEMQPAAIQPPPPPTTSATLLPGGIVHAVLPGFSPGAADELLAKITKLRETSTVRGVVLDLRGNGGGRQEEVNKLLGAFAHGKITSWSCDVEGRCEPISTDDTTPLLKLPMVLLTDSMCASACDDFSGAVKDLKLGKLVGSRTAGKVSGLPIGYALNDNTVLLLVERRHASANGEIVNEIGVAVDYQAPMTAQDLSAGRDPAITKALTLLA